MAPRLHPVCPGLTFIERGWLNGNHLAYAGSQKVLIDTGYEADLESTLELIEQAGVRPDQVELIITTHVHCDHIGAHARIQRLSGCHIALHEVSRFHIDHQDRLATWWDYYGQMGTFFPTHRTLIDGELIRLDDLTLQVIHTPGHAGGMICLYAPDTGWLFSSDAAWDGDFGVLTTRVDGLDCPLRQRDTLERLARLRVTRLYPGHGPPVEDGPAAIAGCLERIVSFLQEPRRIGRDQVRKILLYHLLMHGPLQPEALLSQLLALPWYREACDQFFGGRLEQTLQAQLEYLQERGLVILQQGNLACSLPA